jgi:hypothetical protein
VGGGGRVLAGQISGFFAVRCNVTSNKYYQSLLSIDKLYHIQVNCIHGSGQYRLRHNLC